MIDARDVPAADVGLAIPLRLDAVLRMLRVEHRKAIPAKTIMRRLLPTAETTPLPAHGEPCAKSGRWVPMPRAALHGVLPNELDLHDAIKQPVPSNTSSWTITTGLGLLA